MAGVAVRESAAFAGRPDQVREARAFVGRLLGPSHPCGDVAVLLASEMVTNSLLHGSGEAVTVTVVVSDAGVRVEVTGRKGDGVPVLRWPDEEAEGSRGLRLVAELAVRWGYERGGGQGMSSHHSGSPPSRAMPMVSDGASCGAAARRDVPGDDGDVEGLR
jgi:hypothetical protein